MNRCTMPLKLCNCAPTRLCCGQEKADDLDIDGPQKQGQMGGGGGAPEAPRVPEETGAAFRVTCYRSGKVFYFPSSWVHIKNAIEF